MDRFEVAFNPLSPNDKSKKRIFLFIKSTPDNKSLPLKTMRKIRQILGIKSKDLMEFEKGHYHFMVIIKEGIEYNDYNDWNNDYFGVDNENDINYMDEEEDELWNEYEKYFIGKLEEKAIGRWRKKNKNKKKDKTFNYVKYEFDKIIQLKNPVKFTGNAQQGINRMTHEDLNNCLDDENIGFQWVEQAERMISITVTQTVCVGIKRGHKTGEIREGNRPILDINVEVKYFYSECKDKI